MSPVGSLGFLLVRSRTAPVTEMVVSLLRVFTSARSSGVSRTTWVVPKKSLSTRKAMPPPTSRRFSSQPQRVTVSPAFSRRSSPQLCVLSISNHS